jgi:hypothetical protein
MAAYVDHTFYADTYKGTAIAQSEFPGLALRASAVIDQVTFDRTAAVVTAGTDTSTIEKIKLAACAVADEFQKLDASGGAVQSERVGNVSVTYQSQLSEDARLTKAAKLYLWNTGLMYRGFTDDET